MGTTSEQKKDNPDANILIIGSGIGKSAFLTASEIKEKYSNLIVICPDEENEHILNGGKIPEVRSTSAIKINPLIEQPVCLGNPPSGRESRRKRRKQQRKNKK